MVMVVQKKYITVLVNIQAVSKKLCFYELDDSGERLVMDFDCKIDFLNPTGYVYIDVTRFFGKHLKYYSMPEMHFVLQQTDEKNVPEFCRDEFCPFIHFTPQYGWNNDPNGLIQYHGIYHMFYQYNPLGTEWGNMHWGHAISRDLLHWEEQDIALFPDSLGVMYSGSAVEDVRNVTGLQTGEFPPMLLFYTAAGDRTMLSVDKTRTQCLAYSNDGGKTFEKYSRNPIIENVENYNRDPKVVYVEELSQYVLILYLADSRYGIFRSSDLITWTFLQEFDLHNESECPDMFSCTVEGKKYWVIMGASYGYIVAVIEKGRFVQKTEERQLGYSRFSYAGQSISGMEDNRVVRIAWNRLYMPSRRAPHQMSIPTEIHLKQTAQGLFLSALPVKVLEQLYISTEFIKNVLLSEPVKIDLKRAAYDIHLLTDYRGTIQLELFGRTLSIQTEENYILFGQTRVPISLEQKQVDLRIIVDRCSIELFADGGMFCATFPWVCDYNLPYLQISADAPITIQELTCSQLQSIHNSPEHSSETNVDGRFK